MIHKTISPGVLVVSNGRVSRLEAFRAVAQVLGGIAMMILGAVASAVALHYIR